MQFYIASYWCSRKCVTLRLKSNHSVNIELTSQVCTTKQIIKQHLSSRVNPLKQSLKHEQELAQVNELNCLSGSVAHIDG